MRTTLVIAAAGLRFGAGFAFKLASSSSCVGVFDATPSAGTSILAIQAMAFSISFR